MTLTEFADILGVDIEITRFANQNERWIARFKRVETKVHRSDSVMTGTYGNADSPYSAMEDYVQKIRGKWLVIDAMGENRREFGVPGNLTI